MGLSSSEQMLLQRLMGAGAMQERKVHQLAARMVGEEVAMDDVDQMLKRISEEVRPFSMDVRRAVYDDGMLYFGIVNTSNDDITKFSSAYKPWEIVFLRKAIQEMIESDDGVAEEADLFNLRDSASISDIKTLVARLVDDQWLSRALFTSSSFLTVGPRTFLELSSFLRTLNLLKCAICKYELVQGMYCRNSDCEDRSFVHPKCLERREKRGLDTLKCEGCSRPLKKPSRK